MGRGDEWYGEEEGDDREVRKYRGGRGAMAERGWCAGCGDVIVEAWLCDACSHNSMGFACRYWDDRPSQTATLIGRVQQRERDRGAAHEQFVQLQTVCDPGVSVDDSEEAQRSARIRSMRMRASGGILSRSERETIKRTVGLNFASAFRGSRPRARLQMRRFAEMWTRVAWQIIDDLTRPDAETVRVLRAVARQSVGPT